MAQDPRQSVQPAQPLQPDRSRPLRRVVRRGKTRPVTERTRRPENAKLRLVGSAAPDAKPPTQNPTPIDSATDPRWVLAVSTAQLMEGDVLPPLNREVLMGQGKSMGLSPFDCSLILATIQDRARRGIALDDCPAASESQLALIPRPAIRPIKSALGGNPKRTLLIASGLLALQVLLIWVWLG